MKVLVVSEPGLDGVFRHVEALLHYLFDHGHEVLFAWSNRRTSDRLFGLVEEVNARGGATLCLQVGNAPAPRDVPALWQLARFVRRHEPDLIHAHSSKAGGLARLLPLLGIRAPILYTPHAYYRMHEARGWKTHLLHFVEAMLGRIGWTVSLSPSEEQFARQRLRLPAARLLRVRNGVDPDVFSPATPDEAARLRAAMGIPSGARVLGTLGRLSPQKDPVTLYRALAQVLPELPDLFFLHVGKGELEPEVDELVRRHNLGAQVRRVPYLAQPLSFYRCLDGFILPSLYEGMSYAALEALALDLPLILTRAPGSEQFADLGLSHLTWAEPGDADSVAAAIRTWHRRANEGNPSNHRAVTMAELTEDQCFGQLCRIYARCSAEATCVTTEPAPARRA